jgi:hypothetical protein
MGDTLDADALVWKALADPTRRAVLDALAAGPASTGQLVERFDDLCRTAVMKHLDVLQRAGLDPMPIQRIHERWVAPHVRGTAAALSRLKDHVETGRTSGHDPATPRRGRRP